MPDLCAGSCDLGCQFDWIHLHAIVGFSALLQTGDDDLTPSQLAQSCEVVVTTQARARDIELSIHVDAQTSVLSDGNRLKQVLVNLLSNGIKYNHVGGRVRAWIRVHDSRLIMGVHDTGIGMTLEQQKQLFLPFNRLGRENDASYEGTGLGLSISKRVIEAMGGHIHVSSAPGQGSTFIFTVALSAPPGPAAPHS